VPSVVERPVFQLQTGTHVGTSQKRHLLG